MFKTKVHAGKMIDCLVCTPEQDRRKKRFEKKVKKEKGDLYSYLKRQVNEEGGEEVTPTHAFALNQKYGVNEAKIEQVSEEESKRKQRWLGQQFINESRKVTKPTWKEGEQWKTEQKDWLQTTKPLITAEQYKKPLGAYQRAQNLKQRPKTHFQPIQFPQKAWQKPLPTSPRQE